MPGIRLKPQRIKQTAEALAFLGVIIIYALVTALPALFTRSLADQVTGVEAVVQILIAAGLLAAFLVGLERRLKRNRALKEIHRLREVARDRHASTH